MPSLESLTRDLSRLPELLHRHPRRVAAAVCVLLAGTGVTAFGVAPLTAIDVAPPTQRILSEELPAPPSLQGQLDALDLHALRLHQSALTRQGDTADTLLRRLGIDDPEAAAFLRADPLARRLLEGRSGKQVQVERRSEPGMSRLERLVARGPAADAERAEREFTRLTIERGADGRLLSRTEQAPLSAGIRLGSGTIESSLFAAADASGIPDAVTVQMAEIFSADLDFRRELRTGDTFTVVYEALTADGEPVSWSSGSGRVLSARFINAGRAHEAVWFQEPGRRGAYYGLDGNSKQRMFLSSPLAFSRVTSGFAMRFHPIHKTWRAHLGVDYGAPTGTPVRVVGEGTVEFAGSQNGYGNVVQVRHAGNRSTLYAHLSRIDVRRGQRVDQGQIVGAVGSTGWATGPHLHFEFKLGGQQVDPMKIARASETVPISAGSRGAFQQVASVAREQLGTAASLQVAGTPRME